MTQTIIDKLERADGPDRSCRKCVYSKGHGCNRDKRDGFTFSQAYETRYTGSDFCGPTRRYFKPLRARSQGGE